MSLSWHQARAAGLHRLPYDIVGYVYRADVYCPRCISSMLPTGEGEAFDGWKCLTPISAEDDLTEIAQAFGIDREDESSFDSGDFPKVVLRDQLEPDPESGTPEHCGQCGEEL